MSSMPANSANDRIAPVAIRHHAVERSRVAVEHQRQEVTVAFPHRQLVQAFETDPPSALFVVAIERRAFEARGW